MGKKDYLIMAVMLIVTLTISSYSIFVPKKALLSEVYKETYDVLDYNINIIESNMNEITVDNKGWHKLKKVNIKDEKLINTYNSLISDIKKCYLLSADLKNETYDNVKVLSLKNKKYITKYKLSKLNKNETCLNEFDKYNSIDLSDNKKLSEKLKTQINIIIDHKQEPPKNKTFYELLYDETIKMSKIASLSKWLKVEYNTYKL